MIWIFCVQLSLWTYKPGEGKGKGSTDQSELRLGSFWPHPQPIISFLPPFSHSPDAILQFTHKLTVKLPAITDARMVFLKAWIYLDINIHLDLKEKWSSIQFFWWQLFNCQDKTSGKNLENVPSMTSAILLKQSAKYMKSWVPGTTKTSGPN